MGWPDIRGIAQLGDLPCAGTRSASWQRSLIDPWYERFATPRYLIDVERGGVRSKFSAYTVPAMRANTACTRTPATSSRGHGAGTAASRRARFQAVFLA